MIIKIDKQTVIDAAEREIDRIEAIHVECIEFLSKYGSLHVDMESHQNRIYQDSYKVNGLRSIIRACELTEGQTATITHDDVSILRL